ncbi:MAG TPA: thioredoxin domain-containing protein [bacterium]|nr:thioredoxin domain-containing protein [bacterium]
MTEKQNRLRHEKSPYLLQHKDNPVHWYAWGEEAFKASRESGKPIFLSIGYSTCHWCHVMEHESFENQEVADQLNREFIAIKVDREERPDVDDIYMSAIQAMRQRGGWPLSMFLTPDLKPFYGGTYWPKALFMNILAQVAKVWREQPGQVRETGESIVDYLKMQKIDDAPEKPLDDEVFDKFLRQCLLSFDREWGGFGQAPKFPHAMQLAMLLRIHRRNGDPRALEMVKLTLDKMARGGIYDHLGGGFARYSTDEKWLVPHFEKMLYDNAQLTAAYLEAFQASSDPMFREVARESLDYVLRAMSHGEGGFYSAEDADSEGEEGKFYVWSFEELRGLLEPEEFDRLSQVYQVQPGGNFEYGHSILWLAPEFGWSEKKDPVLATAMSKLFTFREARIHPHLDDKILTAWNGLMIRAMALGYQVLGEAKYLEAAHRSVNFLRQKLWQNGKLLARYRDGEGRFAARLDDYAYLIQGLIDLYESDFRPETLTWALELQERQFELFWDESGGGFFFTDGQDPSLLVRGKEAMDGALPNANAVSAWNLLRLHSLTYEDRFRDRAGRIFRTFSALLSEFPTAFSTLLIAYDLSVAGPWELAIVGSASDEKASSFLQRLRAAFHPHVSLAFGKPGQDFPALLQGKELLQGETAFYLCRDRTCDRPRTDPQDALKALKLDTSAGG